MELSKRAMELMRIPQVFLTILTLAVGRLQSWPFLRKGHVCVERTKPRWRQCRWAERKRARDFEVPDGCSDVIESDMGDGLGFQRNVFDGAISISALQWLCYPSGGTRVGDSKKKYAAKGKTKSKGKNAKEKGKKRADSSTFRPLSCSALTEYRLHRFFLSLRKCLRKNAKAVLQFYPEATTTRSRSARRRRVGFRGGLVVDYPTHAKGKILWFCRTTVRKFETFCLAAVSRAAISRLNGDLGARDNTNKLENRRKRGKSKEAKRLPDLKNVAANTTCCTHWVLPLLELSTCLKYAGTWSANTNGVHVHKYRLIVWCSLFLNNYVRNYSYFCSAIIMNVTYK